MTWTRRSFFGAAGAGLATLFARGAVRAFGAPAASTKTVVVLMQRGAVDGLAMIPPHGDPELARARPSLGSALGANLIDLDGHFGLHAGLAPLFDHWTAGRLAIVPAVGLTGASRSHFEAQDLLEQGAASESGWANRMLAHRAHTDTTAIAVGNSLPRALAGEQPALVVEQSGEIGVARKTAPKKRDAILAALTDLYAQGDDPFTTTARRALVSAQRIEAALAAQPTSTKPQGPIGQALVTAARLIRARLGTELIVVDTVGWDTHTAESQRLDRQLHMLGDAVGAFATELGDLLADVTLVTISEFGRTVRENGTGGTDHGTATMSLVLGGAVHGKRIVGPWPGLATDKLFEGRDLAITTDTRNLLADVLAGTLAVDSPTLAALFPNHTTRPLGLMRG
ncbi:DUF1501 domain-containing protein [soil metagenome]